MTRPDRPIEDWQYRYRTRGARPGQQPQAGRPDRPIRVAIIGGGCAGITTAFELTRPEHRGRYQVTVYQQGWRLGGKGASGRGVADRIEEHGLHLWMGCYENAFRLMRECYAELGRDPRTCPIAEWYDAFIPDPVVGLAEHRADGRSQRSDWQTWLAKFPPRPGLPGDPLWQQSPFTVRGYMMQAVLLLRALLESAHGKASEASEHRPAHDESVPPWARSPSRQSGFRLPSPEEVVASVENLLRYGQLATVAALVEAAGLLRSAFDMLSPVSSNLVLRLLDSIAGGARRQLEVLLCGDPALRRVWEVVDLILASLRGAVRFGLAFDPRGFDAINDYDWREWLRLNGASDASLDSAFIRGIYDLTLAYEDGDSARPAIAAGVALRFGARMFFTYRGSLFYKMQAGMGDVVFAPFYEVLERRGVSFEFFHRLTNVELSKPGASDSPHVAGLHFDVQAEIAGGGEYEPLVDIDGLPCWPSEPRHDQLVGGEGLKGRDFECHWERHKAGSKTLRVTEDFDFVVLAIGVGAIPHTCAELVARDGRWRDMVHNVKTVATQAFQIWLDADAAELGWTDPSINLSAFVKPFDTWADMSHLAERENWPEAPGSIAYFCSVLPESGGPESGPDPVTGSRPEAAAGHDDAGFPARQRDRVREAAMRYLERDVVHLWPRAVGRDGRFRWELLSQPSGDGAASAEARETGADATGPVDSDVGCHAGPERFASQYWTANVSPSDRYVLSLPGTQVYRISPLDMSYDNLTIAGDWTDCGLNTGCVESAVISGRLAAHALSHFPPLADIVGYDHP